MNRPVTSGLREAGEIDHAPPPFAVGGKNAVPIDFLEASLEIVIDIAAQTALGRSTVRFHQRQPGCPLLDMEPDPVSLILDGQALSPSQLAIVTPPGNQAALRVLDVEREAGPGNLIIEYPLTARNLAFGEGGVRLGFFMTDLGTRGYLERYAPANLEFDQTPVRIEIRLAGATAPHRLFSNGAVSATGDNSWTILFPAYFTSSSFFLHLTDRPVEVLTQDYAGLERAIPVTVYGDDAESVSDAMAQTLGFLAELEGTYGAYAHAAVLVYVVQSLTPGVAGMEYCGATMTMIDALGHELTHSWFARGVMPADGNAGWIDEAIARWRDNGYPRQQPAPNRPPRQLSGFSPYHRHTPRDSYTFGSLLLSELDFLFASRGGLRPILSRLYRQFRRQLLTTPAFQEFLEQEGGVDLERTFARFVYGRLEPPVVPPVERPEPSPEERILALNEVREAWGITDLAAAPRAFTNEELRDLI
jgi:hypothetical protein